MAAVQEEHRTTTGEQVRLEILQFPDAILVTITNLSYEKERKARLKNICLLLLIYFSYRRFLAHNVFIDFCLLGILAIIAWRLMCLIKCETLTFINEFALHTSTMYFMGLKKSTFIPKSEIHDVVINEVVCDLKVIYLLAIRTKGGLYNAKPIIPLFNRMRPNVDCLESIYKTLRSKFLT